MNFDEIKKYWEDRASIDSGAQSTTQDYYLREIEFNSLFEYISKYAPASIADIGCGDGRTTIRLASKFPHTNFVGFDYSSAMINNAHKVHAVTKTPNIKFEHLDICSGLKPSYNLIYTTRCLINLPSWDYQKKAITNIHKALDANGIYIMVENFIEGHMNFNKVRREYGLSEISVREHNLFFQIEQLHKYIEKMFFIDSEVNISSTYYLVSRVIYSKICAEKGIATDYFDGHHRFAAGLPFSGEYGPIRLLCLRKK